MDNWIVLVYSFSIMIGEQFLTQQGREIFYSNFGAKIRHYSHIGPEDVCKSTFSEGTFWVALTGMRYYSLQIHQFSIAKIMTFYLDMPMKSRLTLRPWAPPGPCMEAHWSFGGAP